MKYPTWLRATVAVICAYEAVAITADNDQRIPTITYLQTKHHTLGAILVTALAVHFIRADH